MKKINKKKYDKYILEDGTCVENPTNAIKREKYFHRTNDRYFSDDMSIDTILSIFGIIDKKRDINEIKITLEKTK
jgi:hypothetical protein